MPTPLVLSYYNGLALQRSADDQTCICMVTLTELVFMAGAKFVTSTRDVVCPSNYTYNSRFDHIFGSLPFRLPPMILVPRSTSAFTGFASRMGTDLALTALEFPRQVGGYK